MYIDPYGLCFGKNCDEPPSKKSKPPKPIRRSLVRQRIVNRRYRPNRNLAKHRAIVFQVIKVRVPPPSQMKDLTTRVTLVCIAGEKERSLTHLGMGKATVKIGVEFVDKTLMERKGGRSRLFLSHRDQNPMRNDNHRLRVLWIENRKSYMCSYC
jgi:hypothetical protein